MMSSFSSVQRFSCAADASQQQQVSASVQRAPGVQGFPGWQPRATFRLRKNDCQDVKAMARLKATPVFYERAQRGEPCTGEAHMLSWR